MVAVTTDEPSSMQTRLSLLNRLKAGEDAESWSEFYRIYGRLVRDFSLKAGLNGTEADDIVQETMIAISRHLPEYRYDPKVCRFKTWLLNQTSWRIKDLLKKKRREMCGEGVLPGCAGETPSEDTARTSTIYRVPDPASTDLDALFETEWRKNLFTTALERVKAKFSLKQFQIFDLLVLKEWAAAEVAQSLGVTLANVYVTRHRISAAIKKETRRLEHQFEQSLRNRATGAP